MALTVAEIGKLAGCSGATVSRALSNKGPVSAEKREAIARAMRQAEFAESRRGRTSGDSLTIEIVRHRHSPIEKLTVAEQGLEIGPLHDYPRHPQAIVSSYGTLGNSFYQQIVDGITSELSAWGCRTRLRLNSNLLDPEFLRDLNNSGLDGVILVGECSADTPEFVRQCSRPLVLVDHIYPGAPDVVTTDNFSGISQLCEHLFGLGHRKIGYVGRMDEDALFTERFNAYRLKMLEAGLTIRPEWVYAGPQRIEETASGVKTILGLADRPTAFVCSNDCDALSVVRAASSMGIRIPEELSVVGFDDVEFASLVTPPLTTVHVRLQEMGRRGVQDLMVQIQRGRDSKHGGCQIRLAPTLVVRKSTGRCPAG